MAGRKKPTSRQSGEQEQKSALVHKNKQIEKTKRGRKPNTQKPRREQATGETEGKKKKEEKKSRKRSQARLGRPPQGSQEEILQVHEDPTIAVQESFIKYLHQIGLKHGLVFRDEERAKFQKQELGIKWNDHHEWDEAEEKLKIQASRQVMGPLRKLTNSDHQWSLDILVSVFLNIGQIAASECTENIYLTLAHAIDSILAGEDSSQQEKRAEELLQECPFLSGRFTRERIKYWVQIHEDEAIILFNFKKTFLRLVELLKEILKDSIPIRLFLQQQDLMNNQLNMICN